MQEAATKIRADRSLARLEGEIVPVKEVFRLQDVAELKAAEKRYLPTAALGNGRRRRSDQGVPPKDVDIAVTETLSNDAAVRSSW